MGSVPVPPVADGDVPGLGEIVVAVADGEGSVASSSLVMVQTASSPSARVRVVPSRVPPSQIQSLAV